MRDLYNTCVGWPPDLMPALHRLIDERREISREEFLPMVGKRSMAMIEASLGYDRHLRMKDDWHVRYFVEDESGIPFFVHSGIEHVFASDDEISALNRAAVDRPRSVVISDVRALYAQEADDPDAYESRLDEIIGDISPLSDRVIVLGAPEDISSLHGGLAAWFEICFSSGTGSSLVSPDDSGDMFRDYETFAPASPPGTGPDP